MNQRALSRNGVPRDFDGLRSAVMGRREALPKRLIQVADYALGHPDEIAFGTAASIAQAAGVQPSTLVRFAHQFGFTGFSDMQSVFRERLKNRNVSYQERIVALRGAASGSPELAILNGFLDAASQSISKLPQRLDLKRFRAASKLLAGAETIYLIARRRSFPLASYMAYGFGKMGIKAQLLGSPVGIDDEVVAYATPRDAAIAISFNPYAPETVKQTRAITSLGVPVIAITDSSFSAIAEQAEHWFEIAEDDFAGFRSLSASMAFCMALTVAVADVRKNDVE
ncbi:MAG TPA: MurR/RpiR family transcriptional regulator [Hyphomicrobiales bacterium]|jgi:DNA-binding MurR/RpiR family transcriptional regulator